jgi:tRNA(Ile)-lysidine synthase
MDPSLPAVVDAVAAALAGPCAVADGTPIAAACSGGADSVALVAALARLGPRWPLERVVFVDHGLRDVADERASARTAAEKAGVPFAGLVLDPTTFRGNLQDAARAARYRAIEAVVPPNVLIATGHTADDQTETMLQRIGRGTGLAGLCGIPARRGRLVRPMLSVPRSITQGLDLSYSNDPTNAGDRFLRNRLRAAVVPALVAENPQLHEAFSTLADAAAGTLGLLSHLLDAWPEDRPLPWTYWPPSTRAAMLRHLSARVAPTLPPRADALCSLAAAVGGDRPCSVDFGNGWRGLWRAHRLRLLPDNDPRRHAILQGLGTVAVGGRTITVALDDGPPDGPEPLVWPLVVRAGRDNLEARGDNRNMPKQPLFPEIRDGRGSLIWPDPRGVSTVRKPSGLGGVFAIHVRPQPTLTVERSGHIRLCSDDSAPQVRLGR